MLVFTPQVAGDKDSLVVMAGGMSSGTNIANVKQYIKDTGSWVLAANYDYGVQSKFTYFGDAAKLVEQIESIDSDVIVSAKICPHVRKYRKMCKKNGHNIYQVVCGRTGPGIYASDRVRFAKTGAFSYNGIGTSGLACLALSMFFNPSKLLLVGFDGPSADAATKVKFDGSEVDYGKPRKMEKEMNYVRNSLLPTLKERGIELYTFDDVAFYGMDKEQIGLKVISIP